jgi:glutathione S-transferase
MADFTVVIGNKNYSSWSMRGWLMARIAGIEFDEIVVPLDRPETQAAILAISQPRIDHEE